MDHWIKIKEQKTRQPYIFQEKYLRLFLIVWKKLMQMANSEKSRVKNALL